MESVQIIQSKQINNTLWDACVLKHQSPIYATSIYLHSMASNWAAVVVNDYEVLLPFCYKKKFGITYLYMPPFLQQLGLVGKTTPAIFALIQQKLFSFVSYGDFMVNANTNTFLKLQTSVKTNFELKLNKPHENLLQTFHTDFRRLLKRAKNNHLQYLTSLDTNQAIELYYQNYASRFEQHVNDYKIRLKALAQKLQHQHQCFVRKIVNAENEILSVGLYLKDDFRIYNIANTTTSKGRKLASNFLLFNEVLNEFENSQLIFDFEGSDLPGVKEFYKMFNPTNQPYYHWHINNLPWFLKMLKK
ncbi:MAG: hypothetical protein ACOVMM_08545 [Chitinophagaceae bacterium]